MTSPLLFDELLDSLRREGFSIGTDQYLRMHALFERHITHSPEALKTLLCPLFATSAAEQERFHVAYDEFFTAQPLKRGRSGAFTVPGTVRLPPLPKPHSPIRWKVIVPIVASIIALFAVVMFWPSWPHRPAHENRTQTRPAVKTVAPPVQTPPPSARQVRAPRTTAWLLGAALMIFAAEVGRTLLRWLRQRGHRAKGRPFDWPVRDPHPTAPRLFADRRFFSTARLMKGREVGEVRRLDIGRSILATIRALGDPTFEYKLDRRVTEYLFLVERRSERDHLAAYVHAMVDALVRDGVLAEVYEHDGDPRHCWKAGTNARMVTGDLYSRYPQHRLVIVGNAVALTNCVTGEAFDSIPRLFPWNYRAILTLEDESRAVKRFGAYFDVYALANNGLARLAERWQESDAAATQRRRTKERRPVLVDLPSSPDEMERELGPLIFRWLLRCAVHPTLHWDLTRELAPPLPAPEHEAALIDLARLEWFRQGRIPEPERLALVSRLAEDEPEETAARTSALRVLAAAPPPPAGTVAAAMFEIQQLAHRIWSARDEPSELRPLIRKLRHYSPAQVSRDGALMMLLHEAPGSVLSRSLPQSLRQFLFRGGIPAFGMKNFVAAAAMLPVLLFAGNALRPDAALPPPVQRPLPKPIVVPKKAEPQPAPVPQTKIEPQPEPQIEPPTDPVPAPKPQEKPIEPAPKPVLAALPTLVSPAGMAISITRPSDVVTFIWRPAGAYTLEVRNSQGVPVHTAAVRGTSATWKPTSASFDNTWTLTTADSRTTDPVAFDVEYEVAFTSDTPVLNYRTVEITLPVSCTTTEGRRDVDLRLSPRETFVTAELKVLNAGAFTTAELTPTSGASFSYRFIAAQPCPENTLEAKVRVTATIRLNVTVMK